LITAIKDAQRATEDNQIKMVFNKAVFDLLELELKHFETVSEKYWNTKVEAEIKLVQDQLTAKEKELADYQDKYEIAKVAIANMKK
jgi:hypothetical protein